MKVYIFSFIAIMLSANANAQADDIEQLILDYEKLDRLKKILQEMYRGYKILEQGYETVRSIAEGNFNLHAAFLDGLYLVNPAVRQYKRIPAIVNYQLFLTKEYKRAYNRFQQNPNLSTRELKYLESVYAFLVKSSLRNIEELTMIVTDSKLRMSDAERLNAIDRIYFDMGGKVSFLQYFNNGTQLLLFQRTKEQNAVDISRKLFGLK